MDALAIHQILIHSMNLEMMMIGASVMSSWKTLNIITWDSTASKEQKMILILKTSLRSSTYQARMSALKATPSTQVIVPVTETSIAK